MIPLDLNLGLRPSETSAGQRILGQFGALARERDAAVRTRDEAVRRVGEQGLDLHALAVVVQDEARLLASLAAVLHTDGACCAAVALGEGLDEIATRLRAALDRVPSAYRPSDGEGR